MLHRMPLILAAIIAAVLLLHGVIPLSVKAIFYAMSLTIKSLILFVLPIIIFGLLFKTMVELAGRATIMIALILVCLSCSSYAATFMSHFVGEWVYHLNFHVIHVSDTNNLLPAWEWQLPRLIQNNHAMFAGIFCGIVFGQLATAQAVKIAKGLDSMVAILLNGIAYLIPLFVTGFIMKLQYDGMMQIIVRDYFEIFAVIIVTQCTYLFLLYCILNNFSLRETIRCIKNMLPAAMAGFATMSSAAVLPITLNSVAENATNKNLARSVVSISTNIHLLGDCIAIPVLSYALMKSFGLPQPALYAYIIFTCYFVIAKFSVAAVPAGGIIVMLPLLESHFGFTADMLSLILALYVLFDPICTTMNVMGNGALAKLMDRLVGEYHQRALSVREVSFQPN